MNEEEIISLVDEYEKYNLLDVIMHREFAIGLVKSEDPMFLLKIPQPFRDVVIKMGTEITDQWYEISNNGTVNFSEYAKPLHELVTRFLESVPVGSYINWKKE